MCSSDLLLHLLLGCLELNSEERCSDEDRCKWLGEKTICHNVAGWTATKGGMGCSIFAQKYCRDGDIKEEFLQYASSQFNYPADNCCECGLKTKNEQVIPVKPVNRDTIYNKCTVQKADEGNWRAEKYCESFGDNYLACNKDAG